MDWSDLAREGFALAAAAHADRGGAKALRGLAPEVADHVLEPARRKSDADRNARRAWVSELLRAPSALELETRGAPPRALGLLATSVDRATGKRWLALSPLPRPGYAADPRLLALLRKLGSG
jgi:hypothetical protein